MHTFTFLLTSSSASLSIPDRKQHGSDCLNRKPVVLPTSWFAYIEVILPARPKSFRLHGLSRFTYTKYLLLNAKYLSKNCSYVFRKSFPQRLRSMLNAVSTNELINLKITNRNSLCAKNRELEMICHYFVKVNSSLIFCFVMHANWVREFFFLLPSVHTLRFIK